MKNKNFKYGINKIEKLNNPVCTHIQFSSIFTFTTWFYHHNIAKQVKAFSGNVAKACLKNGYCLSYVYPKTKFADVFFFRNENDCDKFIADNLH